MKFSAYYFHMKTKTLADFQICISVPLIFHSCNNCVLLKRQGEIHWSIPFIMQSFSDTKFISLSCRYFGLLDKTFRNLLFPAICKLPVKM